MTKQLDLFGFDEEYSIFSLLREEFLPDENYEIEYKSGQGGFPKELWKTYSAFANTNTGVIIIGIKENRHGLTIEGLTEDQISSYTRQFWNDCNNPSTISVNLLVNDDLKVIEINGKKLLAIRVPYAQRTDRPVHLTKNPIGNTYKRNHEGDYRCTEDEVKHMIADSSAVLKRDSLILEHFTLDDLDSSSISQFRQLFKSSFNSHPWHALGDLELLTKLGAYRKDRKSKIEGITLAGLLMFGKYDAIREQDALPDFFPDFREKLSTDKNIRWTNRIYPDGTWESNLLQFYLKVWPRLSGTLPKPFQLQGDERTDENPAHEALREAFVNTLVHTDYSQSGNIIIELDTERFVFSNPGTLLVSLEQYYAGGISECRNPSLQQMFMFIGRAEKAGSGVDKIMEGWKYAHWRRPFVEIESRPNRIQLTMPMFSIIPEGSLQELQVKFGDISQLSPDELSTLYVALVEGTISNHRLQYMLEKHPTDITILLKKLCTENYLESDSNGRWTTYKLKEKVATSDGKVDTSNEKVATSKRKVDTSLNKLDNQGESDKKVATSDRKVDTSNKKVATSKRKVDTSLKGLGYEEVIKRKVDTLRAKVDTSKIGARLSREELEKLIMEVCDGEYLSMEEVSHVIEKSEDYLKNKIFPKMIKDKKLVKRYPYTHNHPEQGYKTADKYAK